jgi:hypothetical protein
MQFAPPTTKVLPRVPPSLFKLPSFTVYVAELELSAGIAKLLMAEIRVEADISGLATGIAISF